MSEEQQQQMFGPADPSAEWTPGDPWSEMWERPGVRMLPEGVTPKRGMPYLWVTWLTSLLAGDDACELRPWMKAHFRYPEQPRPGNSFDLEAWKAEHTALVSREVERLRADGYRVTVEDQNKFALEGRHALVGGKPDIIAYAPDRIPDGGLIRVIDLKGGKVRAADYQQVLLYLYALPRVAKSKPAELRGEVLYGTGERRVVQAAEVTPAWVERLGELVRRAAGNARPAPTPSARECAFCDVPKSLCPARVEDDPAGMTGAVDDF